MTSLSREVGTIAALLLLGCAWQAWKCARFWWVAGPMVEAAKEAKARAARRLA